MNTSTTDSKKQTRSNIFIPKEIDDFIKKEAKRLRLTRGEVISLAVRALEKQRLKEEMELYYGNPENRKFEQQMAEESTAVFSETLKKNL